MLLINLFAFLFCNKQLFLTVAHIQTIPLLVSFFPIIDSIIDELRESQSEVMLIFYFINIEIYPEMTRCSTEVDFKKLKELLNYMQLHACDTRCLLEISAIRTKRKNSVFHQCYQPTYCLQNFNFFTVHTGIIDHSCNICQY